MELIGVEVERQMRRLRARALARRAAAARRALVLLYGCRDCGAKAGQECKPEYGCVNADRCLS